MPTELLNTTALAASKLVRVPFQWAHVSESFRSPEIAARLAAEFPSDGFGTKHRRLGESSVSGGHYLNGRGIVTRETAEVHRADTLSQTWRKLTEELLSEDYREAVQELTGFNLEGCLLEAIAFSQPEGGYLDPHPDNPGKPVSQVFYFNEPGWKAENGGCLRILRSNDIEDYSDELPPTVNTSVVLVRSNDSWHGYKPVRGATASRMSLQIFFCQPSMKFATEYGPDWTRAPRITRPLRLEKAENQ